MATSGSAQVVRLQPIDLSKIEVILDVTLNSDGVNTSFDVTLSEAFQNAPKVLIVTPLGDTRTWEATYSAGTPKLTLSTTATTATAFASKVVRVLLYAADQL